MGKNAKLKVKRKLANLIASKSSAQDSESFVLADFYLHANDNDAALFRLKLADSFLNKTITTFTPKGEAVFLMDILCTLPNTFVLSYINLVGHSLVGSRHNYFWHNITNNLLAITTGVENEIALEAWGKQAGKLRLLDDIAKRTLCYYWLQQLGERCDLIKRYSIQTEVSRYGVNQVYLDAIPTHLVVSSCVAKKQIIHQSGSLILCYAEDYMGDKGKELWLAKKRHDGIYTTSSEARDGSLKVSEVRDMRQFVKNYQGLEMQGTLCPGREKEAARICKFVGLRVDSNLAYLGLPDDLAL
jgi:hypothetical protein